MPNEKVMFIAMSLFCVIDALYKRSLWCASDHLHTFEAISFSDIVQCGRSLHSAYLHTLNCRIGHRITPH